MGDDLIAALIVTVLLVPQSLAYALLAGLPPVVGVVASMLPLLAYAAFGSSTTLAVGPVAVLAMMTAQVALPVAQQHGVSVHLVAMVLALQMAVVFALAALLRLDALAALLSAPVLHGFITGAAIMIALAQLPSLLGLNLRGHTLPELAASAASAPALAPHPATAAVGLLALALLWLLRRHAAAAALALGAAPRAGKLAARLAPMLVVLAAIGFVIAAPGAAQGVALAGGVDLLAGLDFEPVWNAPAAVWWALLPAAGLLGLVAYVESLAVAEALAARRGEKVQPRRELQGLAAANAAAALGGMPVTGGFARSIVNFDAGARTRMAGVYTALLFALAMLAFGAALQFLPKAVLAATIIVAVLSLVEIGPFKLAWRWSRAEFALMLAVALLTVLAGVDMALGVGVALSAALLLQRTARPHWAEVGRLPGTEIYRNLRRFEVQTLPHVACVRIDEALLFTNSRWLSEMLSGLPVQRPALEHVVLMMSGVNAIDFTGLLSLRQLAGELQARDVRLHLSELKGPVADRLRAAGMDQWLTGQVHRTQHDAHCALQALGAARAAGTTRVEKQNE